jgi:hypothetical protein
MSTFVRLGAARGATEEFGFEPERVAVLAKELPVRK